MIETGVLYLRCCVIFGALGLVCAALVSSPGAQAGDQGASEFLTELSEKAVEELADPSASESEKEKRFRELMAEAFDLSMISKFVLATNWRSATPEQRKEFVDVFEAALVHRFLPMFQKSTGETLKVTGVRQDQENPKLFFVSSMITRPEGEPYAVEWRVRARSSQYKILDMTVEGVSMALTLRQEYSEMVQDSGVDGLIAALRRKVKASGS